MTLFACTMFMGDKIDFAEVLNLIQHYLLFWKCISEHRDKEERLYQKYRISSLQHILVYAIYFTIKKSFGLVFISSSQHKTHKDSNVFF